MAHLTIYLPDEALRKLRSRARQAGKSVSSFVADLIGLKGAPDGQKEWAKLVRRLAGSCPTLPDRIADRPPEKGPDL